MNMAIEYKSQHNGGFTIAGYKKDLEEIRDYINKVLDEESEE